MRVSSVWERQMACAGDEGRFEPRKQCNAMGLCETSWARGPNQLHSTQLHSSNQVQ